MTPARLFSVAYTPFSQVPGVCPFAVPPASTPTSDASAGRTLKARPTGSKTSLAQASGLNEALARPDRTNRYPFVPLVSVGAIASRALFWQASFNQRWSTRPFWPEPLAGGKLTPSSQRTLYVVQKAARSYGTQPAGGALASRHSFI